MRGRDSGVWMLDWLKSLPNEVWVFGAVIVPLLTWLLDRTTGIVTLGWNWFRRRGDRPETIAPPRPTYPKIIPPAQERPLVGRVKELERIRTILAMRQGVQITGSKGVALKAEGGRGKTALAREYAKRHGASYDGGKWLRAQSKLALIENLSVLGQVAFAMAQPSPLTEGHARAVLEQVVNSGARWLLVYDNVDDVAVISILMPDAAQVDVIVTTRLALNWDSFGRIDVEVLDFSTPDSDAVNLLLQEARLAVNPAPATRAAAQVVAQMLGGLPLALVMAGAVLREDAGVTLADLPGRLDQVLRRGHPGLDYPDSVMAAVGLTYGRLTPDAQVLAELCAWLAPEGVSEALFAAGVKGKDGSFYRYDVSEAIAALLENPDRLRDALRDLRRWSVLTGAGPFEMHRLTQAVLRAGQTDSRDQAMARAAAAVLAAQFPGGNSPQMERTWHTCRALLPHVQAIWALADPLWQGGWGRPGWAEMDYLLNQAGIFLSVQADLPGAIAFGRASLMLKEARLSEDHRGVPLALGNLALDLAELLDEQSLTEAEALIARAVRLDMAHRTGAGREDLAGTYMQQASIAFQRMERDRAGRAAAAAVAETALARAWAIRVDLFGADSAKIANVWNQTAYLRRLQNRKAAQLAADAAALRITRALPGADRGDLATRAMNAGVTALELGRAIDALPLLREAYSIHIAIYAPDHPKSHKAAYWLATCLLKRAAQGDAAAREQAVALCARHGLSLAELEADATSYPDAPEEVLPDEDWPWVRHPPDLDPA